MNAPFDPFRSLRTLSRHGVHFVLIGGLGARLYGSPSTTNDIDICDQRTPENLQRLAAALRQLDAKLRGVSEEVPFQLDAAALAAGDHFTFTTKAGGSRLPGTPAGIEGFEELRRNSRPWEAEGVQFQVASIDDLILMKRAAGRPKDLIEIEVLAALKDEVDRA